MFSLYVFARLFIHSKVAISLFVYLQPVNQLCAPGGLVVECSSGAQEVLGSIPSPVIPKTLKMVLDASFKLLNFKLYLFYNITHGYKLAMR